VSFDNGLSLHDKDGNLVAKNPEVVNGEIRWRPDSQGFFIESEEWLYYTSIPNFDLRIVDQSSDFNSFTWVEAR
jgi:hypothetical protein